MNKDIETLREAISWLDTIDEACATANQIRAIAARMEQQSKAEPVAWMTKDGRLCSPATKTCAMHKSTAAQFSTPLFTHPPAEALDAARLDALPKILSEYDFSEIPTGYYTFFPKEYSQPFLVDRVYKNFRELIDAAIAAKEGK